VLVADIVKQVNTDQLKHNVATLHWQLCRRLWLQQAKPGTSTTAAASTSTANSTCALAKRTPKNK
jgi:hypothetical protein